MRIGRRGVWTSGRLLERGRPRHVRVDRAHERVGAGRQRRDVVDRRRDAGERLAASTRTPPAAVLELDVVGRRLGRCCRRRCVNGCVGRAGDGRLDRTAIAWAVSVTSPVGGLRSAGGLAGRRRPPDAAGPPDGGGAPPGAPRAAAARRARRQQAGLEHDAATNRTARTLSSERRRPRGRDVLEVAGRVGLDRLAVLLAARR